MRSTKKQIERRRDIIKDIIGPDSLTVRAIAQQYFRKERITPRQYWVILSTVKRMRDMGRLVKMGTFIDALWANA